MATESKQFQAAKLASLNATQNNKGSWTLDAKYAKELVETMQRVSTDLNEGIIKHCKARRTQQLQSIIADKCFSASNDLSYVNAKACESYLLEKDYKLSLMNSFFSDHMAPHTKSYLQCYTSEQFNSIEDAAAKDQHFLQCHNRWIRNLKQEVLPDLEEKAAKVFLN